MKQTPKRLLAALLLTAMLAALPACRGTGEKTQTSDADTTAPVDVSAELADEPITDYNMEGGYVRSTLLYDHGYLYFYVGSPSGRQAPDQTLFRYNVRTGNLTTVCPDPLCTHSDRECPFYAMDISFAVHDNKIVYDRYFFLTADVGNNPPFSESVCYDLLAGKLTTFYSVEGTDEDYNLEALYIENFRFYSQFIYSEESDSALLHVCRMDLTNGDVTVFEHDSAEQEYIAQSDMLFAADGKLYFSDGKDIFYTDFDLQGKQTVMSGNFNTAYICTDGEYMYFGAEETEGSNLMTLYRAKLDGSEKMPLNIQTGRFTLTENYIYYQNAEWYSLGEDKRSQSSGGELRYRGSALCRAAHDGSGQEEVFSYWQGDTFYSLSSPVYVDNKIYALYSTYTDADQDGAIRDDEYFQSSAREHYTILCIDLTTGEMDYIYCGTEPQTTP